MLLAPPCGRTLIGRFFTASPRRMPLGFTTSVARVAFCITLALRAARVSLLADYASLSTRFTAHSSLTRIGHTPAAHGSGRRHASRDIASPKLLFSIQHLMPLMLGRAHAEHARVTFAAGRRQRFMAFLPATNTTWPATIFAFSNKEAILFIAGAKKLALRYYFKRATGRRRSRLSARILHDSASRV